jgi:hypothetical protein
MSIAGTGASSRETLLVHPEHEHIVREWLKTQERGTSRLVVFLVFLPLAVLAVLALSALVSPTLVLAVAGLALIAIAAVATTYPFPTPLTVRAIGLRRSIAIVRLLTMAIGLAGVAMLVAAAVDLMRAA